MYILKFIWSTEHKFKLILMNIDEINKIVRRLVIEFLKQCSLNVTIFKQRAKLEDFHISRFNQRIPAIDKRLAVLFARLKFSRVLVLHHPRLQRLVEGFRKEMIDIEMVERSLADGSQRYTLKHVRA
ncbi:hypothetical protein CN311_13145 [Mesorhizobium sanjuanii]|uniref:Uncharacterized protein n=1 Tax=Mesorhizobium sanjuanii TaxID=2037900 RepID=A0A2A6FG26_9HYPH|nr:hypothetical protein CN311_13145 [Mesorhizobium sanjuanii]